MYNLIVNYLIKNERRIAYLLIPFLIFYLIIIYCFRPNEMVGDESRYLNYASNLTLGYFSPRPNIFLWVGPGYSSLLAIFLKANLPILFMRCFNAILLYSSLIIVYQTCRYYLDVRKSLLSNILLALYFPVYFSLPYILTEILAFFLISLCCYSAVWLAFKKSRKITHIVLASIPFVLLVLTKIIFAHVVLIMIPIISVGLCIPQISSCSKLFLKVFGLVLLFLIPYSLYTYSLTNKVFYFATSGGYSLYTLTSLDPNETGEWQAMRWMRTNPYHSKVLMELENKDEVTKDMIFKKYALLNLKSNPIKVVRNWASNVSRLFIRYPHSYKKQELATLFYILPNMIFIVFIGISILLVLFGVINIPPELILLFLFFSVYLFASTLLSTYVRMFYVTAPVWTLLIGFVLFNSIKIVKVHR